MPRSPTSLDRLLASVRWTQDQAREVFAALDASGLTITEFAAQHAIQAQRLFAWRRKFEEEPDGLDQSSALTRVATSPAFVEVAPQRSSGPVETTRYELVLARGAASLRVEGAVDATTIRALLALLKETLPC